MMTRVFDCHRPMPVQAFGSRIPRKQNKRAPLSGVSMCAWLAMFVVPLAGASERPGGWLLSAMAALAGLGLARLFGNRLPLGWLVLTTGSLGLVLPRSQLPPIGPPLFTATLLLLVLWLANHDH